MPIVDLGQLSIIHECRWRAGSVKREIKKGPFLTLSNKH
jgi:hypothetical protein